MIDLEDLISGSKPVIPEPMHRGPCIYFLLKEGMVVYVGQSKKNGMARIKSHIANNGMEFDSFTIIDCAQDKLCASESDYIKTYLPDIIKI